MEYYNGILCISGNELIYSEHNPLGFMGISRYKQLAFVQKKLKIVRRGGGEGTPVLVAFDSLPPKYKEMAKERIIDADPDIEVQRQKILNYIEHDQNAVSFFSKHRIEYSDNKKGLEIDIQLLYSNNAAVLNAIKKAWDEHVLTNRASGHRPMTGKFWNNAAKGIQNIKKEWKHDLPKNPKRLREKLQNYVRRGYISLISGKFAGNNATKISKKAGEWLVAHWASPVKILTLEQLHEKYNQMVEEKLSEGEKGWKILKSSLAIRLYLNRPEIKPLWWGARYGELSAKEKLTRQNRTKMPSFRDSLWYSDGTKMNFYYQDENGNPKTCQVYEVMDTYSEVFLGYHISPTEDYEAQYYAFKMAIQVSKHKPYELKYDNQGGHKKLESSDFLGNLARHAIHTAPYNGRSKTIESAFGRFQMQHLHEEWYFTGQNITATKEESHARMEFILANVKNLPTLEEAKAAYLIHRENWNNGKHHKTKISRTEMYRTSVNVETPEVNILDMISMFGITPKRPSTYRGNGIEIEVKGKQYAYEVLDHEGMPDMDFYRRNIDRKFYVRYDPDNMNIVSLYEPDVNGGMRFIDMAQTFLEVQRNIQEQTKQDLHIIRQVEIANKKLRIELVKNQNELLERYNLHPNQHGLNVAPIKGITSGKRKSKGIDIGEIQKEVSNMAEIEERRKADKRVIKKAAKEAEKEAERTKNNDEFNRKRIELLQMTLN